MIDDTIRWYSSMLVNEGTSATWQAKIVAIATGCMAASVLFAGFIAVRFLIKNRRRGK